MAITFSIKKGANGRALKIPPLTVRFASDFTLDTSVLFSDAGDHITYEFSRLFFNPHNLAIDTDTGVVSGHFVTGHPFEVTIIAQFEGIPAALRLRIQPSNEFVEFEEARGLNLTDESSTSSILPSGFGFKISPALGDIDGDGDLDLVVVSDFGEFRLFLNDGAGGLTKDAALDKFRFPDAYSTFVDFDGDGDHDLVLANTLDNGLVRFDNVNGTLNRVSNINIPYAPRALAFADVDGDGDQDLVVGAHDGSLKYFENTAGPNASIDLQERFGDDNPFAKIHQKRPGFESKGEFSALSLIDVDADGDLDFFLGDGYADASYSGEILYYRNDGDFGFTLQENTYNPLLGYQTGSRTSTTFGDINGNGAIDLLRISGSSVFIREGIPKQGTVYDFTDYTGDGVPRFIEPTAVRQTITSDDLSSGRNLIYPGEGTDRITSLSSGSDTILVYVSRNNMGHLVLDDVPARKKDVWQDFVLDTDRVIFAVRGEDKFRLDSSELYEDLNFSVVLESPKIIITDVEHRVIEIDYIGTSIFVSPEERVNGLEFVSFASFFRSAFEFLGAGEIAVPGFVRKGVILTHDLAVLNYVVPADYFLYDGSSIGVTYTATRIDGSALPANITFNASARAFSAIDATIFSTPMVKLIGSIDHDSNSNTAALTISDTFELMVGASPFVRADGDDNPIDFKISKSFDGSELTFTRTEIAALFDPRSGDITDSIQASNLPVGVRFNSTTGVFSVTPFVATDYELTITARNPVGSFSQTFTFETTNPDTANPRYNFRAFTQEDDALRFIGGTVSSDTINGRNLNTNVNVLYLNQGADLVRKLKEGIDVLVVYVSRDDEGRLVLDDVPKNSTEVWREFELGKDRIIFAVRDTNSKDTFNIGGEMDYAALDLSITNSDSRFTITGVDGRTIWVRYTGALAPSLAGVSTPLTFTQLETAFGNSGERNNFDFIDATQVLLPGWVRAYAVPSVHDLLVSNYVIPRDYYFYDGNSADFTYTARLSDGTELPPFIIVFDAATRSFSTIVGAPLSTYKVTFTVSLDHDDNPNTPALTRNDTVTLVVGETRPVLRADANGETIDFEYSTESDNFSLALDLPRFFTPGLNRTSPQFTISDLPLGVGLNSTSGLIFGPMIVRAHYDLPVTITNNYGTFSDTFALIGTNPFYNFVTFKTFGDTRFVRDTTDAGSTITSNALSTTGINAIHPSEGVDTIESLSDGVDFIIVYASFGSDGLVLTDVPANRTESWGGFELGKDRIIFVVRDDTGFRVINEANYTALNFSVTHDASTSTFTLAGVEGRTIEVAYTGTADTSLSDVTTPLTFAQLKTAFDTDGRNNFDFVNYREIGLPGLVRNFSSVEVFLPDANYVLSEYFIYDGVSGSAYSLTLADGTALPDGLRFDVNSARLVVDSNIVVGRYNVEFIVYFGGSPPNTVKETFDLMVASPLAYIHDVSEVPDIMATAGEAVSNDLKRLFVPTSSNSLRTYNIEGLLPPGLFFSRDGVIVGKPSIASTAELTLTVTNVIQTITDTFTITVTGTDSSSPKIAYPFMSSSFEAINGTVKKDIVNSAGLNSYGNVIYRATVRDTSAALSDGIDTIVVYTSFAEDSQRLVLDDIPTGPPDIWNGFNLGIDRIVFVVRTRAGTDLFPSEANRAARNLNAKTGSDDDGDHILFTGASGRVIRINYDTASLPPEFVNQSEIESDDLSTLFDVRDEDVIAPVDLNSNGSVIYLGAERDRIEALSPGVDTIVVYTSLDSAGGLILDEIPTGAPEIWDGFDFGIDRIVFVVRGKTGLDLFETQADYDARGLNITRGSDGGDHILVSDVSGRVIRINYITSSLPSEFIAESKIGFDDLSILFGVRNVATGVDTITQRLNFDVAGYDQITLSTAVVNHPLQLNILSATDNYTLPENFITFAGVNATSYTITGGETVLNFNAATRELMVLGNTGDGTYPIVITGQNSDGNSLSLAATVLYNIQPPRLTSEESFGSSKVFNTGQAIFGSAQESFTFTDEGEVTIKIASGTATKVGAVEIGRGYTKIDGDHGVLTAYSLNGKVKWTYTLNDDADYSTRYEDQFTVFAISEGGIETLLADGALTIDITTSEVTKVVADRTGFKSVVIDESAVSDDKVVLGGDSNDEIIAGTGRDVVSGGRGIDRLILSADTVADTVVYAFDARVPQGWTAYDGADTISGFDLGTDKLTLQARVDGTTPVGFFDQFANANIKVQLLLSGANNNMVDGVTLSFVASGDGYGGISAGNSLTIKFATTLSLGDVIPKIGDPSNFDSASGEIRSVIRGSFNALDSLLRGTDSGDAGDHFDIVSLLASGSAPSGALSITGDAVGGSTLVVDQGTLADADGLGTISYQWVRFDVDTQQIVNGGTGAGYTISAENIGDFIRVVATYKDDGGTDESVISHAVRIGSPAAPNIEPDAVPWLADDSIALLPDDAHLPPVDIL